MCTCGHRRGGVCRAYAADAAVPLQPVKVRLRKVVLRLRQFARNCDNLQAFSKVLNAQNVAAMHKLAELRLHSALGARRAAQCTRDAMVGAWRDGRLEAEREIASWRGSGANLPPPPPERCVAVAGCSCTRLPARPGMDACGLTRQHAFGRAGPHCCLRPTRPPPPSPRSASLSTSRCQCTRTAICPGCGYQRTLKARLARFGGRGASCCHRACGPRSSSTWRPPCGTWRCAAASWHALRHRCAHPAASWSS